jgi:hypothetical protein
MAATFDEAVAALYQAPHEAFVAERKRLAGELKAAGDKAGAARFAKLNRPPISAWAVNQLWWQARADVEKLLAAAARLKKGDQSAAGPRRDALAALRAHAATLLERGGHSANEATLRRVTTTLSALAAAGGFDPDPAGALGADRDPPGFDMAGLGGALVGGADASAVADPERKPRRDAESPPAGHGEALVREAPARAAVREPAARDAELERAQAARDAELERERAARDAEFERERAARDAERERQEAAQRAEVARQEAERRAEQERHRIEVERAARRAERRGIESSLPALRGNLERRQREVERLRVELERVERLAEEARAALRGAEARLAALGNE